MALKRCASSTVEYVQTNSGGSGMKASGNILVVGVGGQGVMTAAEVLAETALAAGYMM